MLLLSLYLELLDPFLDFCKAALLECLLLKVLHLMYQHYAPT